ncbi:MAG: hypothetical protein ACYC2G_09020 [Gemmatimonadaceae bacterium]
MSPRRIGPPRQAARLIGTLLVAVATTACGGGSDEPGPLDQLAAAKQALGDAGKTASAYKEMGNALAQIAENADSNVTVEPVDFRELRDMLPADLAGLPRAEASGEKTGAMGMTISKAEARYAADGDDGSSSPPSLNVTITDVGAMRGMGMLGLAAWTMAEVDKETADGFERTTKYQGQPAYEKFSRSDDYRSGNIQVVVGGRFMVEVEGENLDFERIKGALDAIPLKKLEAMKDQGVTRGG